MREQIINQIIENGAIAVIRLPEPHKMIHVAEALYEGGVKSIEITMSTPNAIEVLGNASQKLGDKILFGVGTVLNAETARAAIDNGAKYVVSPVFKQEILDEAHRQNIPVMPGAFSPTEILTAFEAGADIVKVFPADILGMAYFKAVLAPLPHLKLMPTGGVNLTNAGEWLKSGACAVGVGSALVDNTAIKNEEYAQLTANAKILMNSINSFREKNNKG